MKKSLSNQPDTIFAEATGAGRGAISIVRISGPHACVAIEMMAGAKMPDARRASVRGLVHPESGDPLDEAMVLWLPGPDSFTGEDMVELHCHGGAAVRAAIVNALGVISQFRPAEPGEFSKRAFFAGRLDLTQAEGIDDLVAADTEQQRRQALRQMGGALAKLCEDWRSRLIAALAHVEAEIDFVDEPLPLDLLDAVRRDVSELTGAMEAYLADDRRGERLRDGLSVAIVGPPNAGKSSIINWLANREAAIVSDIAGTTRDVVEIHMDLDGFPVLFADTAGIRDAVGRIEREGVRRALLVAEEADIRLVVLDGEHWPAVDAEVAALVDDSSLVVVNKLDIIGGERIGEVSGGKVVFISCMTGEGLNELVSELTSLLNTRYGVSHSVVFTRERHRTALTDCCAALVRFLEGSCVELGAEDLRLAARALGRITGRVDVDELLDVVFRDFCIGK